MSTNIEKALQLIEVALDTLTKTTRAIDQAAHLIREEVMSKAKELDREDSSEDQRVQDLIKEAVDEIKETRANNTIPPYPSKLDQFIMRDPSRDHSLGTAAIKDRYEEQVRRLTTIARQLEENLLKPKSTHPGINVHLDPEINAPIQEAKVDVEQPDLQEEVFPEVKDDETTKETNPTFSEFVINRLKTLLSPNEIRDGIGPYTRIGSIAKGDTSPCLPQYRNQLNLQELKFPDSRFLTGYYANQNGQIDLLVKGPDYHLIVRDVFNIESSPANNVLVIWFQNEGGSIASWKVEGSKPLKESPLLARSLLNTFRDSIEKSAKVFR